MIFCVECAKSHDLTPATIRLDWDLGHDWLCEKCYRELTGQTQKITIEDAPEKMESVSVGYRSKKGNTDGGNTYP